ncbi:MAG: tyrosine-type recombinase/integrase [Acidobacteriota bacterium]
MQRKSRTHIPGFGFIYQPSYKDRNGQQKRSKVWWMRHETDDKPVQRSTGKEDQEEAFAELMKAAGARAKREIQDSAPELVRIGQLLDLLIESYAGKTTAYDLKIRVEKHIRPAFGDLRVVDLKRIHLDAFVKSMRAKKVTASRNIRPATINRCLSHLHKALDLGRAHDLVSRTLPPFPWQDERGNERQGIMPEEIYQSLRKELPPHAALVLVIGYHTGMRQGEILGLRWDQIDFAAKVIWLESGQVKNKRGRWAPIYRDMGPYLEMACAVRDKECPQCPWVVQFGGKRIESIRTAWETACEFVGVSKIVPHDLRRTALTNMDEAGIPRSDAMRISGHKTESAYRRYLIGSKKRTQQAGEQMEAFFEAKKEARADRRKGN